MNNYLKWTIIIIVLAIAIPLSLLFDIWKKSIAVKWGMEKAMIEQPKEVK